MPRVSAPSEELRSTGVFERPGAAREQESLDMITDIGPDEIEYPAVLLQLGALNARSKARSRQREAAEREADALLHRAIELARECGPDASPTTFERALAALRIVHTDPPQLALSAVRAHAMIESLRPAPEAEPRDRLADVFALRRGGK